MAGRIAITGTAVLSAAGAGAAPLVDAMLAGTSFFSATSPGGRTMPWSVSWTDPGLAAWPVGPPWNSVRKYANGTATAAVTVARQVLATSGIPPEAAAFRGASVVAVSSSGGDELAEVMPQLAVRSRSDPRSLVKFLYDEVPDYSYIRGIPSQMGQFVSMANGFRGSNVAVYGETGALGLGALGQATRLIDSDEADAVMVVGVSPRPSVSGMVPFESEDLIAEKAAPGSGPFDVARAGVLLGQGAGGLLLETERSAAARGATVLAWLDGCQVLTATSRSTAMTGAVRTVLGAARSTPGVWLSGAAGSTVADREEYEAVSAVTGSEAPPVTSTRGTIGTAFETAALIDIAVAVELLARRVIPPAGLVSTPDPALIGLDVVTGNARPIIGETGVLITGWNHGTSSGSAGAAYLSPVEPVSQEEGAA